MIKTRRKKIHIINPLRNAAGGSEWRTLHLFRELSTLAAVTLWDNGSATPSLTEQYSIKSPSAKRLSFPRGGTLVIVGVYFDLGRWLAFARPARVVLVYNTPDPGLLHQRIARIRRDTGIDPEIVFCSEFLKQQVGLPGTVETSLIDLDELTLANRSVTEPFTIGRVSRADPLKHHPDDLGFYEKLASAGYKVRIMGATEEMQEAVRGNDALEMLSPNVVALNTFLNSLDVFFYRTDPAWQEPWGRVVTEAMACGLPVVGSGGGYAAIIRNGENGFIFQDEDDAKRIIDELHASPRYRARVGKSARQTIEDLVSNSARKEISAFYLR